MDRLAEMNDAETDLYSTKIQKKWQNDVGKGFKWRNLQRLELSHVAQNDVSKKYRRTERKLFRATLSSPVHHTKLL